MWAYVKANNLRDARNQRIVDADAKCNLVLGEDQVTFETMGWSASIGEDGRRRIRHLEGPSRRSHGGIASRARGAVAMSLSVKTRSMTGSMRAKLSPRLPPIPAQDNDALMARLEVVRATKILTRRLATSEIAGQARVVENLEVLTLLHESIQQTRCSGLPIHRRASQLADDMYGLKLMLGAPVDFLAHQNEVRRKPKPGFSDAAAWRCSNA